MRHLTILLLLITTAMAFITSSLLHLKRDFTSTVRDSGGADDIQPDLLLFYHDITDEELRDEDPEGFAELAAMPSTTERTKRHQAWSYQTRLSIFERRYGRPYTGRR